MKSPALRSSPLILTVAAAVAVGGVIAPGASAQAPPRIVITQDSRPAIDLRGIGGPQGGAATEILRKDLDLSGWFTFAQPAAFAIDGNTGQGGFQGRVTDNRGAVVLSKVYGGPFRSQVHQFADDIVRTIVGRPGIANTKIAFVSRRTGKKEIYVADYDGANVRQITRDNTISVSPAISPDGRRVAYTSYLSGYPDLYAIDLANGSRQRIVSAPGTNSGAAFSPDGSRIALTMSKDGNPEIYLVGAGGGSGRRLTRSRAVESGPSWGPGGAEIVFASDSGGSPQLYRMSTGGGGPRRIATGYGFCTEPSWSPDGSRIAFTTRTGGMSIAVTGAEGGGTQILGPGEDPAWGANSRHLVYSTGSAIVLHDAISGRKTNVITGLGRVSEPSWSR